MLAERGPVFLLTDCVHADEVHACKEGLFSLLASAFITYATCCCTPACSHLSFSVDSDAYASRHKNDSFLVGPATTQAQVLAQEKARYEAEKTGQRLWTAIFSLVRPASVFM
eukprot:scaffold230019_cov15-Tisochrysis_lutea.AAC.1